MLSKYYLKLADKTGKLTKANLKKAGLEEFYDIAGDVVTVFSGDATALEKVGAVADLIIGTDFNNKGQKKYKRL